MLKWLVRIIYSLINICIRGYNDGQDEDSKTHDTCHQARMKYFKDGIKENYLKIKMTKTIKKTQISWGRAVPSSG